MGLFHWLTETLSDTSTGVDATHRNNNFNEVGGAISDMNMAIGETVTAVNNSRVDDGQKNAKHDEPDFSLGHDAPTKKKRGWF